MRISATYICPLRGLAALEPPDPDRLESAAKTARHLGLTRLNLPVLEEALLKPAREKILYLDGLVRALDRAGEAKMTVALMVPAQRLLGLEWTAPFLVRPVKAPDAPRVFVDQKIRNLLPFAWWRDPALVQKRIVLFREVVAAAGGHPALTAWFLFDRFLEWSRPEDQQADWLLKALLAELKERNSEERIFLNLHWTAILKPDPVKPLTHQVTGLHLTGLDSWPQNLEPSAPELLKAAYLGSLAQWIFKTTVEIEVGGDGFKQSSEPESFMAAGRTLARQGMAGINWLSLVDPLPKLHVEPPWSLNPDLARLGLLDRTLEPKIEWNSCFKEWADQKARENLFDFIDINPKEYSADPKIHFKRLWPRFSDSF